MLARAPHPRNPRACRGRLGDRVEARLEEALYGASGAELLARLKALPRQVGSVMLIGHNPGLEELALALASERAGLARMRVKYASAALATIDLPAERWSAINAAVANWWAMSDRRASIRALVSDGPIGVRAGRALAEVGGVTRTRLVRPPWP